jgi:hypothetical protein
MGIPFMPQKSLSDLEEEEEYSKQKHRVLEEKVAIAKLNQELKSHSAWKMFSSNGRRSGFSLAAAVNWLKQRGK